MDLYIVQDFLRILLLLILYVMLIFLKRQRQRPLAIFKMFK